MKANEITSKDNEKIKRLKKLGMKKYRDEFGEFLVENATILLDALRAGFQPTSLFVTQEFIDKDPERWAEIEKNCGLEEYHLIDGRVNKTFSELDTSAGIGAVYQKNVAEGFSLPCQQNGTLKGSATLQVIYLNSISDPGNLGTILRSALAFGIENIVLDAECVDVYNPKTIQAARDAIFKINLVFDDQDRGILKQLKDKMPIYSTSLDGDTGLDTLEQVDTFCLVLGNEAHGVDPVIADLSDELIKIKMSDQVDSLNVSAAAAILFHNIYRNDTL